MNRRGFLFGGATLLAAPSIISITGRMMMSLPPRSSMAELYVGPTNLGLLKSFQETKDAYAAMVLNVENLPAYKKIISNIAAAFDVPSH